MAITARDRIRAKLKEGDTTVRVLLAHPMHTGRGKDENGELIQPNLFRIFVAGEMVTR